MDVFGGNVYTMKQYSLLQSKGETTKENNSSLNLNNNSKGKTSYLLESNGAPTIKQKSFIDPYNLSNLTVRNTDSVYKKGLENSYQELLGNGEAAKTDMTRDDVMNLLCSDERKIIEENNVDLTEKFENGLPRYIFAKGKDGQYHVYDMSIDNGRDSGLALVRLYRTGNKICPNGSGCIIKGDGVESDVYYIDDCNNVKKYENCCYCTISPISLDLNGDGVKTSDEIIEFDIDGDGELDRINNSADAVLVFDKDGNGISGENGSETFGDKTDLDGDGKADGFKNGFEALKAFAMKEGLINGKDDNVLDENDLKILEEKWGFGIKKDGYLSETTSFKEAGITEINLSTTDETTLEDNFDGNGNQLMHQEGATFTVNGESHEYADIWHKKQEDKENEPNAEINENLSKSNMELKKQLVQSSALNLDILDTENLFLRSRIKKKKK